MSTAAQDLVASVRLGKVDLITALGRRDLDQVFRQIFKPLGGKDLLSTKLTCKSWHALVREWINGSAAGRANMLKTFETRRREGSFNATRLTLSNGTLCGGCWRQG